MKCLLTFVLVEVDSATSVFAQDEKTETKHTVAWFDIDNCEVCKSMSQNNEMMEHVKWEVHLIPNGSLSVMVVPEKVKEPMAEAKKQMKAVIARLEKGEQLQCCGYCQGMGKLIQSGAKLKELSTLAGDITLVTSTNADVVEQIHAHANKTIAETKKMAEHMEHDHPEPGARKKGKKIE